MGAGASATFTEEAQKGLETAASTVSVEDLKAALVALPTESQAKIKAALKQENGTDLETAASDSLSLTVASTGPRMTIRPCRTRSAGHTIATYVWRGTGTKRRPTVR